MVLKLLLVVLVWYVYIVIVLYWLIVLLIVCGFVFGWVMMDIFGFMLIKLKYFLWYKWIGVMVFVLVVVCVLWWVIYVLLLLLGDMLVW